MDSAISHSEEKGEIRVICSCMMCLSTVKIRSRKGKGVRHVGQMREEKFCQNREQEIGCLEDLGIDVSIVWKYCLKI